MTGRNAWQRLFEEQVSAITVELDGAEVPLEAGLAQLHSPDRAVRQAAAEAVTAGLAPNLRTRAFVMNTLLAEKATDDRMRHFDSWIASRNLANEASDESVQALVDAVQGRYSIPQRWYTLKAQLLGLDKHRRLRPHGVGRRHRVGDRLGRGDRDRARRVLRRSHPSSPTPRAGSSTAGSTQPARPGKRPGAFCAYTVPVAPPVRVAELDRAPPRRAHARARARARRARVPRASAGRVPPDDSAHARGDRVGVRRDRHVRPVARA